MPTIDRPALASFLRRSRERLHPADVGMPAGPRRRTPGLRRDDVATLTGISTDYYTRLEQARGPHPSEQVLAALARALRLDDDGRDHLFLLAGQEPPHALRRLPHVRPGLLAVLDGLERVPAFVVSDTGVRLAQNPLARALLGDVAGRRGLERSDVYRWFTVPAARAIHPVEDADEHSAVHVASLRATWARRRGEADVDRLVAALLRESPEFAALWERHEVRRGRMMTKRMCHPEVGVVEVDCDTLLTPEEDQSLILLTPRPGTRAREQLDLLRVLGGQDLAVPADA